MSLARRFSVCSVSPVRRAARRRRRDHHPAFIHAAATPALQVGVASGKRFLGASSTPIDLISPTSLSSPPALPRQRFSSAACWCWPLPVTAPPVYWSLSVIYLP